MSTWTITTGHGGYTTMPALPDRSQVERLLSPASRKAWSRVEALVAQHAELVAERDQIESVDVPASEAAQYERAVAAVRAGEPVEHVPTTSALRERASRLGLEAVAVQVVIGEALDALHRVLVDDQAKMVRTTFDAVNVALVDEHTSPEERLDRVLALVWATFIDDDPAWPYDLPEVAQVRQARAILDDAPANAMRRAYEQAVDRGLLTGQPEAVDAA